METITLEFKGDKSLSHRSAIFSALGRGTFEIKNFLTAEDTINTLNAMKNLGVRIEGDVKSGSFKVHSQGLANAMKNIGQLKFTADLGNSGTGSRLLMGLFSGLPDAEVIITGDESLKKRPMGRISKPLTAAGAVFEPLDKLPITVYGRKLLPIMHVENLGSAQVKSALILAAIASGVSLRMEEQIPSRDHTENMLQFCGVNLTKENLDVSEGTGDKTGGFLIEMEPPYDIKPVAFDIWGDISSASFFIILGLLNQKKKVHIKNVLLNPYRDKFVHILKKMGGQIEIIEKEERCGERGGDIIASPSQLHGIEISPSDVPAIIDELPVLTIAGLFSKGKFSYRGAGELRHKESDRISAMVKNLTGLGVSVEEFSDGLSLDGNPDFSLTSSNSEGIIQSHLDHRIVMSFEILQKAILLNGGISNLTIDGKEWVATSFPDFYDKLDLFE
ncbi:MAG: 3-phosphoshikimate 1-carboxyvinyltransferase [Spirochaetia bacterium]|nr:3-phosphoshikimate 1-carboxyvinyltransferase [Spirochaetia bacterium]